MELLRSLATLLLLTWVFGLPIVRAQSPGSSNSSAGALDALLQDYAYRAFVRPRTGIPYDAVVPSNFTGIQVSALRLRSGSLRIRGFPTYKEFEIPPGVIVQPYVERLALIYQNLGNWSTMFYPLSGYMYLAPVLGLLAYDASNLSAKNLPELNFTASGQPMSIKFSDVRSVPDGSVAQCVWFNLDGLANFNNLLPGNTCSTFQQGHFSVVVESIAPSPAPLSSPSPEVIPSAGKGKNNSKLWIILGSVLGGLALLVLLGLLAAWVQKHRDRKKMNQMEEAAEFGEVLHMTKLGSTKAPAAMVTRTQPTIETEYLP